MGEVKESLLFLFTPACRLNLTKYILAEPALAKEGLGDNCVILMW